MSGAIALTMGMRNSLNALNDLDSQMQTSNKRLATGKRVNDALDNASNFFQARAFTQLATDLGTLQDNMTIGAKTLEVASKTLSSIDSLLNSAQGLYRQARATSDVTQRATLNAQAFALYSQVTDLTKDSGYNGRNLLKATPDTLTVSFNTETGAAQTKLDVTGSDTTAGATGLNLATAAVGTTDANIDAELVKVATAISTVRTRSANFSSNLATIQIRQDFTKSKMSSLNSGSDALTLADMNEEGARLSSLQTRQQMSVTALTLANRSDQSILRLF
jgi:flagellin